NSRPYHHGYAIWARPGRACSAVWAPSKPTSSTARSCAWAGCMTSQRPTTKFCKKSPTRWPHIGTSPANSLRRISSARPRVEPLVRTAGYDRRSTAPPVSISPMDYRQLGRTGVQVSPLCLGCMMFGRRTSPEDSYAIIDRALDAGLNFLDTANVYARGLSEEITGEALRRNGRRQRVVLATKVHGRMADDDVNALGNSRRHIVAECE